VIHRRSTFPPHWPCEQKFIWIWTSENPDFPEEAPLYPPRATVRCGLITRATICQTFLERTVTTATYMQMYIHTGKVSGNMGQQHGARRYSENAVLCTLSELLGPLAFHSDYSVASHGHHVHQT